MFTEMPDTILLQVLYQERVRFDTVTVGVKQCCTNPEFPAFGLTNLKLFIIDTILHYSHCASTELQIQLLLQYCIRHLGKRY